MVTVMVMMVSGPDDGDLSTGGDARYTHHCSCWEDTWTLAVAIITKVYLLEAGERKGDREGREERGGRGGKGR